MEEMIIMYVIEMLFKLVAVATGAAGAWLLVKLGENKKLANIRAALDELIDAAVETAAGLQQQFVEKWKAANEDGKLTDKEVKDLGVMLLETTMNKLSEPAKKILIAAGKDIEAIAKDAVDAWLLSLKG